MSSSDSRLFHARKLVDSALRAYSQGATRDQLGDYLLALASTLGRGDDDGGDDDEVDEGAAAP